MNLLTPRQQELLDFIRTHVKAHGFSPSFEELRIAFGLGSKTTVSKMVDALVEKGALRRIPHRERALEAVETEDHHAADCDCDPCAHKRYLFDLQLIQAVKIDPPRALLFYPAHNFRPLSQATRVLLLGALQSKAAPRTRTAVPREAS